MQIDWAQIVIYSLKFSTNSYFGFVFHPAANGMRNLNTLPKVRNISISIINFLRWAYLPEKI